MDKDRKTLRENTVNMNRKQKISHIWYYYKIHIITSVVVMILLTSFIIERINHKEIILNATILSGNINNEYLTKLNDNINRNLIDKKEKKEIFISFLPYSDKEGLSVTTTQRLTTQIAASDLDILILPKVEFEKLAKQGTFMDLETVPNLSAKTNSSTKFIYAKASEIDSTEKAYGIDMSIFPIYKDLNLYEKDSVLAVLNNTENREIIVKFLEYISK